MFEFIQNLSVVQWLEVAVSLLFFLNKALMLAEERFGWIMGAIAALTALYYFYAIGLYVYTVLEIGLILQMAYKYYRGEQYKPSSEKWFNRAIVIIMLTLTLFVFTDHLTVFEFISSVLLLMGTYYLTHEKHLIGWTLYLVAHIFAADIGFTKHQDLFAHFQIASVLISIVGITKAWKVQNK